MVAFSMYRGNLHIGGRDSGAAAERRWERPRPTLSAKRFRRLLRNRSLAIARLAGAPRRPGSPSSADVDGARGAAEHDEEARHDEEADRVDEQGGQEQQDEEEPQQQGENGHGEEEQQHQAEEEEQEEGAVEDADMDDAGEIVVEGDGNGDAEEGQGESEGVDPNQEEHQARINLTTGHGRRDNGRREESGKKNSSPAGSQFTAARLWRTGDRRTHAGIDRRVSYPDQIDEKKRKLNEKLDVLNKKKHDLVQMLKQVLNAEEEIRRRSMQASLRAAMPQPSENATDGSSVSRLAPRMTVDVNFGDVAGDSDAGSNQGTPGRPLHHFHSISPSTASFVRSPFGSLQGHTPRSPATFSMASPSRFAASGHQGQPPGLLHSAALPGGNYVASSPSPAASGGSSSVFRDPRPPNST
ncbi:30 kDa salivary gland allergen Aed a 3 [Panicum miliaceum]|uniref:30 kDa salivary gland allergen Aed a 3 n=1 Tax=Panicum miliaceum TaxID=4540 RepID=A0A3L6S440_PANMI|nr:30 kDa salivary gland allergen Aed a 3 [Panicum miliaceum]